MNTGRTVATLSSSSWICLIVRVTWECTEGPGGVR